MRMDKRMKNATINEKWEWELVSEKMSIGEKYWKEKKIYVKIVYICKKKLIFWEINTFIVWRVDSIKILGIYFKLSCLCIYLIKVIGLASVLT